MVNYFEALGRRYDLPAELLQEIYITWDPYEHPSFADYLKTLEAEIATDRPASKAG